jgi:hypothetical protein
MTLNAPRETEEEQGNLETVRRWIDAYNTDVERMVREFYAPDLVVRTMGAGTYAGTAHFLNIELAVLKAAPKAVPRNCHRCPACSRWRPIEKGRGGRCRRAASIPAVLARERDCEGSSLRPIEAARGAGSNRRPMPLLRSASRRA